MKKSCDRHSPKRDAGGGRGIRVQRQSLGNLNMPGDIGRTAKNENGTGSLLRARGRSKGVFQKVAN